MPATVGDSGPYRQLLLYYYVRKEAVLSSLIEGTQSSLSDLLLYESDEVPSTPIDDVVEVSSYVAALEHGQQRIQEGFPLSLPNAKFQSAKTTTLYPEPRQSALVLYGP